MTFLRTTRFRATVLVFAASAVPSMMASTSCANASGEPDLEPDAQIIEGRDAGNDAVEDTDGCGDACAPVVACDQAEWCPVEGAVRARYLLTSVWGSGPNDVWAAGSGGTIVHWDGTSWTETPSGIPETLNAIWGTGPNDIYAVSTRSRIIHSTGFHDGSAQWSLSADAPVWEGLPHRMRTVWGPSPSEVWVAGDFINIEQDGVIYSNFDRWRKVEFDGGIGWEGVAATGALTYLDDFHVQATMRSIWGTGPSDIWVLADLGGYLGPFGPGAQGGKTFHFAPGEDGGAQWAEVGTQMTSGLKSIWGSGPNDVWAVGARGAIRHFGPGSRIWDIVETPTIADLFAVWARASDDAWVVGEGGTILHFDGTSWTPSSTALVDRKLPNLYGVWGSGSDDVWAVGDGVVLRYQGKKEGK